jgi:hypothetical protein
MKKHLITYLFVILFSTLNYAQFALGGGVGFSTNTDDFAAQIKSQYTFAENWRIELTSDNYLTDNNLEYYGDLNLNINYIFTQTETIQLHVLAGGALFYGSTRGVDFVQKGRAQGFNTGLGMQVKVKENLSGFFDTVFTITDFGNAGKSNRFVFAMGVLHLFE